MNIVITGASGFVGRYLTQYLVQLGYNVIPVSRKAHKGMYQVDNYSESPSGDVLIHLAEEPDRAKVNQSTKNSNASNLLNILAERFNQKIIYASSGVVYGTTYELPFKTTMPVHVTDKYSEIKLSNEKIVLDSGGVIVRLSNLFGLGMASNNVMSDIIKQISNDTPIYVRNDKSVCDFLHISDAVSAISLLLKNRYCGILNVGSGVGTSIRTLVELFLSVSDQHNREIIVTQPLLKKSVNILDISETTKILRWRPNTLLSKSLEQLLSNGESLSHG